MASRKTKPDEIKGVTLRSIRTPGRSDPAARFKGTAPEKGKVVRFTLSNGGTYSGIVADATDANGEVLVEFKDGLTPIQPE
jgi:hypothetical protein